MAEELASTTYIKWEKPEAEWLKLNSDGATSQNKYGCGGLMRTNEGE